MKLDLKRGDRVLMIIKDAPEFYYVFWGCIKAGFIPVPLNTMLTVENYKFIISDSGANALVYSVEFKDGIFAALEETSPPQHVLPVRHVTGSLAQRASAESAKLEGVATTADDECFWLYSSGTTGQPKGVVHAHRDIVATALLYNVRVLGGQESDVYYSIPRLFFAYGLGCGMTFPLWVGATAVLDARRPMPNVTAELFGRFRITVFAGVPTYYSALLASEVLDAADVGSLRRCVSGGEALPEELQRRWMKVSPVPIIDGIGSTEALHIYISNTFEDIRPNSSGRVVPGYQLRITDEAGEETHGGSPGRLWVKGPSVTRCYWNNPGKTASSIIDGWLDTGDAYLRDDEGYYYYCGRNDDMLKVGGIWVSPFEVEAALISHPQVIEAAVVGRPDDAGLVKPEAWIVLKNPGAAGDALADEIVTYCKKTLAPYKYPRWVHFVEMLPKTATGKIQRFKLRSAVPG